MNKTENVLFEELITDILNQQYGFTCQEIKAAISNKGDPESKKKITADNQMQLLTAFQSQNVLLNKTIIGHIVTV